jgi:hypothetical protein
MNKVNEYNDKVGGEPSTAPESGSMPHRGGRTGVMLGDDYGADLSPDATNRIGSIRSFTGSDPADQCRPPGDRYTHDNPGSSDYVVPVGKGAK